MCIQCTMTPPNIIKICLKYIGILNNLFISYHTLIWQDMVGSIESKLKYPTFDRWKLIFNRSSRKGKIEASLACQAS